MNEPEFEEQLRSIRPAAPRRAVEDRIAAEIGRAAATSGTLPQPAGSFVTRLLPGLGWSAAGAAIGIATMLALGLMREDTSQAKQSQTTPTPAAETADYFEPDFDLEHEIVNVDEQGLVQESDEGLARLVRYESVERRRWSDGKGAVTILEVPREDLVLVPVSFQ